MAFVQPVVSEQELGETSFSRRDATFLTHSTEIEYLTSRTNASFRQGWLYPLSLQAYAAALKSGHERIKPYFDFVDFADCREWYRNKALYYAGNWLHELGLDFQFEGIDVARLDLPSQFLLFSNARYLESTAGRLIQASPSIDTFYVVAAENRLPQDFYFDSDIPGAILQWVCKRLGRRLRTITMKHRPRHVFAEYVQRPMVDTRSDSPLLDPAVRTLFQSSRRRVGFVPATLPNGQQVLDGILELGSPTMVFPSTWPPRWDSRRDAGRNAEHIYRLMGANGEWSTQVSGDLAVLRDRVFERRERSSLPECLIRNPNLDFQFDYIITQRWLAYANMIRRAVAFVDEIPLDLFICSDHFSAEGAILAELYRRKGTQILVMLHSGWPCDRNWTFYASSDTAMVPSKSCKEKIRQLSGLSKILVAGPDSRRSFRSLVRTAALGDLGAKKRLAAGDRKIVLLLTNALELDCVPFTDLKIHFQTMALLARIPKSLEDRILIALRVKPGVHGEDPILYRDLCGLSPESSGVLDGLSFSESIQIADCIVGVNVPTTGYFEILEKGSPLIHVQTAGVVSLQPDIPDSVIERIGNPEAIWPAIEAVLFSEQRRKEVLAAQRRFAALDGQPEILDAHDPVQALIKRQLDGRRLKSLTVHWSDVRHRVAKILGRAGRPTPRPDLASLPPCAQGGAGFVEDVLLGPGHAAVIVGWAADLLAHRPAKAVHVFHGRSWLGASPPSKSRPDVAAALGDPRLEFSGFSVLVQLDAELPVESLSVRSELYDGNFFQLVSVSPQAFSLSSDIPAPDG